MIKFHCPNCGQKIKSREERAGTAGRCPRCHGAITIPGASGAAPGTEADAGRLNLVEVPEPDGTYDISVAERARLEAEAIADGRTDDQLLFTLGITPLPEHTGQRRHPWPIDVLLYPTSPSILLLMAVVGGLTILAYLVHRFLPNAGPITLLPALLGLFVGLYAAWYWAECTFDSARGGTRAPDLLGQTTNWRDIFSRVLYLAAPVLLFLGPAVFYSMFVPEPDAIAMLLSAWGIIFLPMGLLAMVMFDSSIALNPLFLLGSIARTLVPYSGLMMLFALLMLLPWTRRVLGGPFRLVIIQVVVDAVSIYVAFLLAHLLGRFYWRYHDRLDWGI